ncbi:MAG: S9 family peptidase [Candidatus Heimdallarchaeota archaeon]|nr:MAG: S9 family peptidase [Candidatus Heimdallarchaeota archaeon]
MSIKSKDFVQIKFPNSPAISPDGKKLVFAVKKVNQKKNQYKSPIYLKIAGRSGYKQFTAGNYVDTAPQFSPSGDHLAFLSSRAEKGTQVFIMSIDGGEAFQVTEFPQGVLGFSWSHNSKLINVIARVNEEELELILNPKKEKVPSFVLEPVEYKAYKSKKEELKEIRTDPRVISDGYCREGTSYLDGRFTQPFIVDISEFDDEKAQEIPKKIIHIGEHGFHFSLGTFSLDNKTVFLARYAEDPTLTLEQEILKVDISDPSEKIFIGRVFGRGVENLQLSPDGRYLSFHAIRKEKIVYDDSQIFLFDVKKHEVGNFVCITENYNRSAIQSRWFSKDTLLFLCPRDGKINIHKIDINTKETESVVIGDRNINSFTISKDGSRLAYEVSHVSFPSDIFWCKADGSGEERVTEANKEYLTTHIPAKAEEFNFERDGVNFQGWLLVSPDYNPNEKMPLVLEIHGGPAVMWTPHEKTLWHEWNTLVSNGYAVVFCNPRGSDGYGVDFRAAIYKNWGNMPAADILKSLDTVLTKYSFLDPNRIAVTGGSYGGYMTSWLVTQTDRFKAAISQRGVYEFVAFSTTTDIPAWFEKQYEGEIIDRFSNIWKDSPVAHVRNLQTPLLIIHSENDFRVPVVNAEQLFWLGKRYGKTVELVRYPRDGHELSRSGEPRHVIDRIDRIVDWIQKYNK